jgi:hypothetical protein
LFNVADRVSGAFGISTLASIFESREEHYVTGSSIASVTGVGTMAFHDIANIPVVISTIWTITAFFIWMDRGYSDISWTCKTMLLNGFPNRGQMSGYPSRIH